MAETRGVEPAIRLEGVTKRYRHSKAGIFDVSFSVARGEIFGFLGPNGAGKTTTLRLLLDLIRPDAGSMRVLGLDTRRDSVAVRRQVGYLPGELALYERLTARELLTHFAHLRGGPPWAGIAELAERYGLELDRPLHALSKGNRQKVGVVQALMGEPAVLVLDEPTGGLDPIAQKLVHDDLRERSAQGVAVLLSSHVLSEVAAVAHRVGIIRSGRVIAVDDVASLRSKALHRLHARFTTVIPPDAFASVEGVSGVTITAANGAQGSASEVRMELTGRMDAVVKALAAYPIEELTVHEPDLEELFLGYYGQHEPVAP